MFVASINSTGRACIAPVTVTALHYYPGSNIVRLPTVVPPLPIVVNNNFGFVESFTIRNNHHFHLEASLDCGSTSKFNNGSSSKYNNSENNMDKSASSTDAVVVAEEILLIRQNKQALRRIIRSRINSTYPNNNESGQILSTKSNHVFSRLFDLPQYKHAKSIGFFLSMPSGEIQTKHAMQKIVTDGKVVYVPRVGLDFEMCDMDLIRCDTSAAAVDDAADGGTMFYDNWPRNKWGIPEPPITASNVAKPGDIDLLIVPGLAFDTNGHRLGQGKGYYDRFISKMRDGKNNIFAYYDEDEIKTTGQRGGITPAKPLLVGVCLEEQFLDELPHGVDFGDGYDYNVVIPISDHDYIMDIVLTPSRALILRNVHS